MNNRLIQYISFGNQSNIELSKSLDSLLGLNIDSDIQITTDNLLTKLNNRLSINLVNPISSNNIINSRYYKTQLINYSRELNLYLDSDTRVLSKEIENIFDILEDDFDLAISYSNHQDSNSFWHLDNQDREQIFNDLGYNPLQYQCGVFGYRNNQNTARFFRYWFNEWDRYKGQDQGAFVRALHMNPIRIFILGQSFNDSKGTIIQHNFGRIRG